MNFDPFCLVSQLSAMDREEGDIGLKCQGDVVKAHSFVLSMRFSIIHNAYIFMILVFRIILCNKVL